jgi:hypothetical protein
MVRGTVIISRVSRIHRRPLYGRYKLYCYSFVSLIPMDIRSTNNSIISMTIGPIGCLSIHVENAQVSPIIKQLQSVSVYELQPRIFRWNSSIIVTIDIRIAKQVLFFETTHLYRNAI